MLVTCWRKMEMLVNLRKFYQQSKHAWHIYGNGIEKHFYFIYVECTRQVSTKRHLFLSSTLLSSLGQEGHSVLTKNHILWVLSCLEVQFLIILQICHWRIRSVILCWSKDQHTNNWHFQPRCSIPVHDVSKVSEVIGVQTTVYKFLDN